MGPTTSIFRIMAFLQKDLFLPIYLILLCTSFAIESNRIAIDAQVVIILYLLFQNEPGFQEKRERLLPGDGGKFLSHFSNLLKDFFSNPPSLVLGQKAD